MTETETHIENIETPIVLRKPKTGRELLHILHKLFIKYSFHKFVKHIIMRMEKDQHKKL